jgi:hypothetical protein
VPAAFPEKMVLVKALSGKYAELLEVNVSLGKLLRVVGEYGKLLNSSDVSGNVVRAGRGFVRVTERGPVSFV